MSPRCLRTAALALFAGIALVPGARAASSQEPLCPDCSVLLISLDTLRADALGAYSPGKDKTPNLDRLAASGALFMDAFSQAPQTTASHMSIFTGRLPWNHGVETPLRDVLDEGIPTLAQLLGAQGYATAWLGPRDDFTLSPNAGFERGIGERLYADPSTPGEWSAAEAWLGAQGGRKTFLFLHTYHVHDPYIPNRPEVLPAEDRVLVSTAALEDRVRETVLAEPVAVFIPSFIWRNPDRFRPDRVRENWPWIRKEAKNTNNVHLSLDRLRSHEFFRQFDLGDPKDLRRLRGLYDACVGELDSQVGEVLAMLDRVGVSSRTIVVVTADHGEQFMEHGRVTHGSLDVEALKVPLLVRIPGVPAGRRVTDTVQSVDILPTILRALGIPGPGGLDGVSLLPLLRGEAAPPRPALAGRMKSFSYRDGAYSYMRTGPPQGLREVLYDRRADPEEKTDLVGKSPGILREYRSKFERVVPTRFLRAEKEAAFKDLDPYVQREIMQTGYW